MKRLKIATILAVGMTLACSVACLGATNSFIGQESSMSVRTNWQLFARAVRATVMAVKNTQNRRTTGVTIGTAKTSTVKTNKSKMDKSKTKKAKGEKTKKVKLKKSVVKTLVNRNGRETTVDVKKIATKAVKKKEERFPETSNTRCPTLRRDT